jgi:hypothetical protein
VVLRQGASGTWLVIDRDATTRGDLRLVAHLSADEPSGNAALVCADYLARPSDAHRACRPVEDGDRLAVPFGNCEMSDTDGGSALSEPAPRDRHGRVYRLDVVESEMSIPVLRWLRCPADGVAGRACPVSLREVVAALESYAPLCEITERAIARHRHGDRVSTTLLAAELERVRLSPIVLNRLLRAAVISAVEYDGSSLSKIAMRCGRTKRGRNGTESGETSWLARRIGLLAEGGQDSPTPWIHTDVLALIARRGLGVSPREVELH